MCTANVPPSPFCLALQSYEGGLGGEPWNEAHGGYTFCGLAALALLGREDALDVPRLLRWAAANQVGAAWVSAGVQDGTASAARLHAGGKRAVPAGMRPASGERQHWCQHKQQAW